MRSEDVIREVKEHLGNGGHVELLIDKNGRRFVKIVKWGFFPTHYEITGATEATIQRLLIAKCREARAG